MISYENLPVELSENRHIVEGNVCLSLWKQPELFIEYPLCSDDFLTKDGQLLYQVGKHMLAEGYSEFDLISVEQHQEVCFVCRYGTHYSYCLELAKFSVWH